MRDIARQRAALQVANERTEQTVVVRTASSARSEERFRSLSAASPIGIFETDAAGRATYLNARWAEIAGVASDDALGEGWQDAIHPDDRATVIEQWAAAVREGRESVPGDAACGPPTARCGGYRHARSPWPPTRVAWPGTSARSRTSPSASRPRSSSPTRATARSTPRASSPSSSPT